MNDKVVFGPFSRSHPDFTSSNRKEDLVQFKIENKKFEEINFSPSTQKHVTSVLEAEYGYDVLEKLQIKEFRRFASFKIVRLKGLQEIFKDITIFHTVTAIDGVEHEDLENMKTEIDDLHQGAMKAIAAHGDQACMMIW